PIGVVLQLDERKKQKLLEFPEVSSHSLLVVNIKTLGKATKFPTARFAANCSPQLALDTFLVLGWGERPVAAVTALTAMTLALDVGANAAISGSSTS
ncbi:MAG: hypothetical protein H0W08_16220, partial [Acidobacteria bacterium]|nr:hypothetical protein [Acidobacteriota bacterium]